MEIELVFNTRQGQTAMWFKWGGNDKILKTEIMEAKLSAASSLCYLLKWSYIRDFSKKKSSEHEDKGKILSRVKDRERRGHRFQREGSA